MLQQTDSENAQAEFERKTAEAEAILAKDHSEAIRHAQIVIGQPNPNPPLSLRLSPPLIEALDRLATAQHRKRTNLIQHILWEYIHAQAGK